MTAIRIEVTADRVTLHAPYTPDLPASAKRLGGKFDGEEKAWSFDARDEAKVRDLARDIYGTDGTDTETVTLRLTASGDCRETRKSMFFLGREVLSRRSRDDAVRLGEGVVLVEGEFARRGGSVAYPAVGDCEGVVLEVRDMPAAAAAHTRPGWQVEVIDAAVDQEALRAERARLAERIAVIDALLGDA